MGPHDSLFKYVVYKQALSLDRFYIHDVSEKDAAGKLSGLTFITLKTQLLMGLFSLSLSLSLLFIYLTFDPAQLFTPRAWLVSSTLTATT